MGVAAALLAPFTSHPSGRSQGLLPVCKRGKAEVPKPGGLPHMCPPPQLTTGAQHLATFPISPHQVTKLKANQVSIHLQPSSSWSWCLAPPSGHLFLAESTITGTQGKA